MMHIVIMNYVFQKPIPKYLIEYGPKRNPFIPWDNRLQILPINDKHTLILNKYPVQIGNVVNNQCWKPQNGWLNEDDFEAIINVDNDTTGLWFFNSSKEVGVAASSTFSIITKTL